MSSELLQKQWRFARSVGVLLDQAHRLGYLVTLGECYRSDEQAEINSLGPNGRAAVAGMIERAFPLLARKIRNNPATANGIRASLHTERLALDLQLFDQAGNWLQDVGPYQRLGESWEALGPDYVWGGRFGDTPHFSIEYQGRK